MRHLAPPARPSHPLRRTRQALTAVFCTLLLVSALPHPAAQPPAAPDAHHTDAVPEATAAQDPLRLTAGEAHPHHAQVADDEPGFIHWLWTLLFGEEDCPDCHLDLSDCRCPCYSGGYDPDDPECD